MDMTVAEYLDFASDLKKAPKDKKRARINDVMELMRIADHRKRLIKNLSKGYKQRVGFAQALIGDPEILILDEPTVGLDPKQIIEIRKLIKSLGKKHTIILSSHILQEVSAVCERVIIINKGRIAAIDTPENLSKRMGTVSKLSVTACGAQGAVTTALSAIYGVKHVEKTREKEKGAISYLVESDKDIDVRRPIFFAMAQLGCPIIEMRSMDMSLEEIFLELVAGETLADDGAETDAEAGAGSRAKALPGAADGGGSEAGAGSRAKALPGAADGGNAEAVVGSRAEAVPGGADGDGSKPGGGEAGGDYADGEHREVG
jgi:ABC-2 type transport system ATP-binding protein